MDGKLQNSISFYITSAGIVISHLGALAFLIPKSLYEETYLIAIFCTLSIAFCVCGVISHVKYLRGLFYTHVLFFIIYAIFLYSLSLYSFGFYRGSPTCRGPEKCRHFRYAVTAIIIVFFSVLQCITSIILVVQRNQVEFEIRSTPSVTTITSTLRRSVVLENPAVVTST